MNKKLHAVHMILLFSAITMVFTGNALAPRKGSRMAQQKGKKVVAQESPAVQVNEELSTIDKIMEQIKRIIKSSGETARKTRAEAKTKINKFMKDLEPQIKQAIEEDVQIILGTTDKNKAEAKEAYNRIIETVNIINAQADVINALDNANRAIKLAPAEMKEQVIAEQVQNVQAAEAKAEEMGMMARMTGRVKSALAAPGNYFFGEQRTALKTAVEVTVGLAATGLLTLAAYKLTPEEKRAQLGTYFAEGQKKAGEYYTKAKEYFFGGEKATSAPKGEEIPQTATFITDEKGNPIAVKTKEGKVILPGDPNYYKAPQEARAAAGEKKVELPEIKLFERISAAAGTGGKKAAEEFRKTSIPKGPEFGEPFLPKELTHKSSSTARRALKKEILEYKEKTSTALANALKTEPMSPTVVPTLATTVTPHPAQEPTPPSPENVVVTTQEQTTVEPTPMTPSPTELPTQQPTPPVVTRQGVTTPEEEMSTISPETQAQIDALKEQKKALLNERNKIPTGLTVTASERRERYNRLTDETNKLERQIKALQNSQ